jgi:SAM-dependent methyltransferase
MMNRDVIDLRDFYASSMGLMVRRQLRRCLRAVWPDVSGQVLLGLGFATPLLRPFLGEAERVLAVMPPEQGVIAWPPEGPNCVTLGEEHDLPLPDMSVDRVVLVHGLEHVDDQRAQLREIWRVLNGSGRLLVVVPNRAGIWARTDRTPFGAGRPYTPSQVSRVLRDCGFTPQRTEHALYLPPLKARFLLRASGWWEQLGARWFSGLGGVVVVEATKMIYAQSSSQHRPVRVARPRLLPVLNGGLAAARAVTRRAGDTPDSKPPATPAPWAR